MHGSSLDVTMLTVGPLEENCWLIADRPSRLAVLVDPGDEAPRLLEAVSDAGCTLSAIWLTHAHFDHVGAVEEIVRLHDVPVLLHPLDLPIYDSATTSAERWGLFVTQPTVPTVALHEGDRLRLGDATFDVWHLPGHAPGHVAFIGEGLCISGDLLFAGSIGRTDLPLCDPRAMHHSLHRVATLDGALHVLCGHGPPTTIARELSGNPFLRGLARPIGA